MKIKIKYCCNYCDKQFDDEATCRAHEILHIHGIEELKYYIQYVTDKDLCSYCDNAYYAYGSEFRCNHNECNARNNYKDFKGEKIYDFKGNIC